MGIDLRVRGDGDLAEGSNNDGDGDEEEEGGRRKMVAPHTV